MPHDRKQSFLLHTSRKEGGWETEKVNKGKIQGRILQRKKGHGDLSFNVCRNK